MPKIAHISDLHLQSGVPQRQAQVKPIIQAINDAKPDLVVISGDVTDDGWDDIDELKWAWLWLDEHIEGDWLTLPGNHDVGNFATLPEGGITSARVDRWAEVFGDAISTEIDGWMIFTLNSMLHGSGLAGEAEQIARLDRRVAEARDKGQHVAVFLHSPLFVESIDEKANPAADYWLGSGKARQAMHSAIDQADVRLIGTGHVHQTRLRDVDGVKIAWAPPASGTWVHAPGLPNPPMPEKTGFFLHTLHDDGTVESELVECAPMLKLYEHNPWP